MIGEGICSHVFRSKPSTHSSSIQNRCELRRTDQLRKSFYDRLITETKWMTWKGPETAQQVN